jgi:hypothetical protein
LDAQEEISAATKSPERLDGDCQVPGHHFRTAQTWAKQGMPVKREGRFTVADPAEVQAWLGQQSHMPQPAHILTNESDIAAALKEFISVVRKK